jgi:putative copper resistance protein D
MSGLMWMPMLPPTLWRVLAIHLQPVPVLPAGALMLLAAYVCGVAVLRRRGDRWPGGRIAWWTAGTLSVVAVTATGLDGYGMELFSLHMVQHMVLGMLTPILLVLGAPVTLLLRVVPARSRARRALLALLHSRFARFLTHPVVVSAIFLVSLYGLYFTPVFNALMSTMWGHNLMLIHFVAVGWLYFWGILGVDPSPRPSTHGLRSFSTPLVPLLELVAAVPFHAFFGIALMMSPAVLEPIYGSLSRMVGVAPLPDQQAGGGIAWAFTEIPTLLVLGVLMMRWQRTDARRGTTRSAAAARRDEDELTAYNARLARLAEHG